jgi:hypothetical protein
MNAHYLNASPNQVETHATITLYTLPAAEVHHEAGVLFFYNFYIRVPGPGDAEARMRCPITQDITLLSAQSHMHRRGVGYQADLTDGAGLASQQLYTNDSWENVPIRSFGAGLALPAGAFVDYRCAYHNEEPRTVLQGLSTRDEMCMFIGTYYPRSPQLEHCAIDDDFYTSDLAAVHVGSGATSCGDSLACLGNARTDDNSDSYTACIAASCPPAANALADAEKCRGGRAGGACSDTCDHAGAAACADCLEQNCAAPFAACRQTTCD